MNAQILINNGTNWFEFSKSKTGQLDYLGKAAASESFDICDYEEVTSSTYFSPCEYTFLCSELNQASKIFVAPNVDISDRDTFSYLVHIGALLNAVEAKDSLLAGELYLHKKAVFEKFSPLTKYILEDFSAEILFSLCFGRMKNADENTIPLIFDSAQKKLNLDLSKETLEQAYIRYFRENKTVVTLPIVGMEFYNWKKSSRVLNKLICNLSDNILEEAEKIRKAKYLFFGSLKVAVQIEPYNEVDKNAILVCIENVESKLFGNQGLEKAGHVRALAAKVIRTARQTQCSYKGKLMRLSDDETVIQIAI